MKISPIPLAVRTTCAYCGVGCGVQATPQADGGILIDGDPSHPANKGKLCVKGSALGDTLDLRGRLLHPQLRGDGGMRQASWDEALERVARGFGEIIAEHGPGAVALYVSGQLLTEDYYVANKLVKGYIGTANIDTNSRLCMSSSVAGHKRAFGADVVPGCYEDFDMADMVVLAGSNAAWCHPVLFQRIARLKERRPEVMVVVVDPRRTATCELADLHLPVRPGTDVWLFNGLLSYLAREGAMDAAYVGSRTTGMAAALAVANIDCADPMEVARVCRVEPAKLLAFYRAFAATGKVVTAYSQGVNQSSAGTDKVNSIINCHLATGRIGKPGMGPFSLTGQPNAMGGREVGGLANMLAAHMELDNQEHRELVQRFWNSPRIADKPGLKAVDLFHAVEQGKVKAVWIIGTNPMVSLPDANQVQRALEKCALVVVSDIMASTDTTAFADVLLPALGWGEKDGTVTNSERCISRQRAFLPAPGEARADWKIICQVAQRMGFDGFGFGAAHEIFDEHARLSSWRNGTGEGCVRRMFDLDGLAGLGAHGYDTLEPVQWPVRRGPTGAAEGTRRIECGGRFVPTAPRAPVHAASAEYPLALNTGRVRDQWHTMTRTGKAPRLAGHVAEAFVDLHPHDALLYGVREGELARVTSAWGSLVARVQHGGGITRGSVFVPIHWNGQTASDARVGALVSPAVDPVSGEPEFKHTPVRVEHFGVSWHGFVLTRRALALDGIAHWTRVQGSGFARYELAGRNAAAARGDWARALLGVGEGEDWLEYEDNAGGVYRAVHLVDDRIEQCVFVSKRPDLPSRAWLSGLFDLDTIASDERAGLLAGGWLGKSADAGPTVCACFGVGLNTLCAAIRARKLTEVSEVTACLKAGGNCGSCVPEIKTLLAEARVAEFMQAG